MNNSKKTPKTPDDFQKEIQAFFKEKFGADVLKINISGDDAPAAVRAEKGEAGRKTSKQRIPDAILNFKMRPVEVKAHLDRFVVGQDEAKRTLAVAVCDHFNHVRRIIGKKSGDGASPGVGASAGYIKQNVILLGPTGVGKTYLIRHLAQLIGVPFVKADSTKYSSTGYVGGDVEDIVRELYRLADGNLALAEHGIIFLDEIDKISSADTSHIGRDPIGRGVQVSLLKLMEETEVPIRNPMDIGSQFQELMQMRQGHSRRTSINTRHILFVVSGAFSGLREIIEKRLAERNVGFATPSQAEFDAAGNLLARATTRDFMDYGFEPEFIGRLPIRVALGELGQRDLYAILRTAEGSILEQYREAFRGYGVEVAVADAALEEIASRACEEKTGARGLMTVLETALREFKFHLAGSPVKKFAVTRELIQSPRAVLERILERPDEAAEEFAQVTIDEWESRFASAHGVRLRLDEEARAMAINVAAQLDRDLHDHLDTIFGEHAEFLARIRDRSGLESLPVTPHILNRPSEGAELWLHARKSGSIGRNGAAAESA